MSRMGIVIIGRNEGERLRKCLQSVRDCGPMVYVDSGSSDGSVEAARSLGAEALVLDTSVPFSAARARNEGFARLMELWPDVEFVQFVDGDCEIVPQWPAAAVAALSGAPDVAAVCGRLRERFPDATVYNRLCDMEWTVSPGEVDSCGGIAMYRTDAFAKAGGFDARVIAGEEPELCVRLRRAGHRILRLADEMGWHDAAMTRFSQWWRRAVRSGHAYAQGAHMHGRSPQRHWVREVRSNWLWGLWIPAAMLAAAWPTFGISLILLAMGYAALGLKVVHYRRRTHHDPASHAAMYALFVVLGKFAAVQGQLKFHINRLRGRQTGIIEYKQPVPAPAAEACGTDA